MPSLFLSTRAGDPISPPTPCSRSTAFAAAVNTFIARNAQMSDFAKSGAFGDNRRGIYEAELAGNQSRDRAAMIASLNDRAFGQARDVAQGESQNANQYDLAIQQLLAQLRGQFANEGTQSDQTRVETPLDWPVCTRSTALATLRTVCR